MAERLAEKGGINVVCQPEFLELRFGFVDGIAPRSHSQPLTDEHAIFLHNRAFDKAGAERQRQFAGETTVVVALRPADNFFISGQQEIGTGDEVGMNEQCVAHPLYFGRAKQERDTLDILQGKSWDGGLCPIYAFIEESGWREHNQVTVEEPFVGCIADAGGEPPGLFRPDQEADDVVDDITHL